MFSAICMAFDAILKIKDAFLQMLCADICFAVLMATIAGVGFKATGMTGLAASISIAMIHGEGMFTIKGGWFPRICCMAIGTFSAELPSMLLWFGMTGNTFSRCIFESIIDMAGFALHLSMRARQRKCGEIVVEIRILPICGVMTGSAVAAIISVVDILLPVTGITILRRGLQVCECTRIEMAPGAGNLFSMPADKLKLKNIMVKVIAEAVYTVMAFDTAIAE